MTDEIRSTPRRQRILFGLPYGLSNATLLAGLSGKVETSPDLPAIPKPTMTIGEADAHLQAFHNLFPRWKPSGTGQCPCGRRISANKIHCARCAK
jgi:hypothetical protein